MFQRYGPFIVLGGLFLLLSEVGNGLGQALDIFLVLIWSVVIGLFAYLILFRGMKIRLFRASADEESSVVTLEHRGVANDEDGNSGAQDGTRDLGSDHSR